MDQDQAGHSAKKAAGSRPWIKSVSSSLVPAEQSAEAAFTERRHVGDVLDLANQFSRQAKQGPGSVATAAADERFSLNLADD